MNANTKTILNISVLTCLFVAASSPCFADMSIEHVSKDRAKALGMEIRSKAAGPNVILVELEFKTEGELNRFGRENFSRVELEIREGGTFLASASLREERPSPDRVVVSFEADRAHLDKITLRVVVVPSGQLGTGYELRVKDFVELENGPDRQTEDKAHCEWLAKIIKQVKTIKVGMSRRDVENVLIKDVGGFANPKAVRYQHPACSYVKVDLEFELTASGDRKEDKITKCSGPLLDLVPNKAKW